MKIQHSLQKSEYDKIRGEVYTKGFFPGNGRYKKAVISYIIREIERKNIEDKGQSIYLENVKENVTLAFQPDSFYMIHDGVAVYFQQYNIAPYSSGILVFTIPFKKQEKY